ncbi:MAG: type II toxin-antitoxin system VapC family toxin [Actinobacteria bacterium]|nr:type II toxin-antitoxin system VapC family toxin [Actinomycetota bacterium]
MGQQVLLDSTVVIAALSKSDSLHSEALDFFGKINRAQSAISAISVGEILIRPSAAGEESVTLFLKGLHQLVNQVIPFQLEHAKLSAEIRAKHKITFADALIIATAIISERKLISFDRKMMGFYERIK